jgi:hypothetical protein
MVLIVVVEWFVQAFLRSAEEPIFEVVRTGASDDRWMVAP